MRNIVAHGYAAVYQDTRGRHGSEGEDRVYADDAADGRDTLDWIVSQPWSNHMVGVSGSSAGAALLGYWQRRVHALDHRASFRPA
jgi:uncharacterized protein